MIFVVKDFLTLKILYTQYDFWSNGMYMYM